MFNHNQTESQGLLKEAAVQMRALSEENQTLLHKLAQYERAALAGEIVPMLEERGLLERETPFMQKVAFVLASKKDLTLLKATLELSSNDTSFARVSSDTHTAPDEFVNFLMTGEE